MRLHESRMAYGDRKMSRLLFFILLFSKVIAEEQNCTDSDKISGSKNSKWHDQMIQNALDSSLDNSENRSKVDDDLKQYINDHVEYDSCIGQEEINDIVDTKYHVLKEEHNRILLILIIISAATTLLSITSISSVIYLHHKILKLQATQQQLDILKETNTNGNSLRADILQVTPQQMTGSQVNLVTSSC